MVARARGAGLGLSAERVSIVGRKTRFWKWYRALPITLLVVVGLVSVGLSMAPGAIMRRYFYPVSQREAIVESAGRHGIDARLVCAVAKCESNWDARAQSGAGAIGLMQVMPSTAETLAGFGYVDGWSYPVESLGDPIVNIEYGCACLNYLDDHLDTTDQVIAAYNAGLGSVQEWTAGEGELSDLITFPETQLYLVRVKDAYTRYCDLYDEALNDR